MGLGHNDPWVESHMWPQQMWGQRSSRGQWPLVQVFCKNCHCIHILWCMFRRDSWFQNHLFQVSRRSVAYQFTINAPLMCPPFSIFRKFFCIFSLIFGQNFSSQDANFPNFCSQDPSVSRKIRSLDPTFGNPCDTHLPKKVECPPRLNHVIVHSSWCYWEPDDQWVVSTWN